MSESQALTALYMGLISAASLPMGAATSAFWRPTDRAIAFLIAFGGGALLAALTIDLVGRSVAAGHFYKLATAIRLDNPSVVLSYPLKDSLRILNQRNDIYPDRGGPPVLGSLVYVPTSQGS